MLCGPLNTMEDYVHDEIFRGRGAFSEVEHPAAGTLTYPGRPFMMSASPWSIRRPAPLLGQHTDEVLSELGIDEAEIESVRSEGVV